MHTHILLPFANMRAEPDQASKVVSQALFAEVVQIQDRSGDWASVSTPDGYAGWVKSDCFITRSRPYPTNAEITRLSAHIYAVADTEYGPFMTLSYGSKLHIIDSSDLRWYKICLPNDQDAFIQKGDVAPEPFDLASFSKKFLGLPYTWGGRSSFGYDCSGYVQMLYSRLAIQLPRDAKEQILCGEPAPLDSLLLGDLIFWGKSEKQIKHVGMFLEGKQFIHTSARENKPYLRISKLSDPEWRGAQEAFYPFRAARRFLTS